MNGHLQLLLQLQELNLMHQSLTLAGPYVEEAGFDYLEDRIARVRRRMPGPMLSQYDALSLRHVEPLAAVTRNVCEACAGELPLRLATQLKQAHRSPCCPHCGRLLCPRDLCPDFLGTK